jgi:GT2 family glycosyltransferase
MPQRIRDDKAEGPALTVCVIAYNSGPTLRECLTRLDVQGFRDFETLVIDNASPDPGDSAIAGGFPGVRLVRNAENLGFAAAGNQGARLGRGRWYVLLNPDAYPEPDWLAELVAAAARHPRVLSFTSRQMVAEEPVRHSLPRRLSEPRPRSGPRRRGVQPMRRCDDDRPPAVP